MNKVIILGKLWKDPELKYTGDQLAVCNLGVATNETWKDKSGQKSERTEWHRVKVFGKQAENCNAYLSKGRDVLVEGRIQTDSFEGKDGKKVFMTNIVANNVQFLGKGNSESKPKKEDKQQTISIDTDASFDTSDLPF